MKHHGWATPLVLILFCGSVDAQEVDNPFQFKKKKVVEETQVVSQPVEKNPNLSVAQRDEVTKMLLRSIEALDLKVEDSSATANIDGSQYVVLQDGQKYVGVSSGMFVVYSEDKLDYDYYDTQQYHSVLSKKEYEGIVGSAKSRALDMLDSLGQQGVEDESQDAKKNDISKPSESPVHRRRTVAPAKIKGQG